MNERDSSLCKRAAPKQVSAHGRESPRQRRPHRPAQGPNARPRTPATPPPHPSLASRLTVHHRMPSAGTPRPPSDRSSRAAGIRSAPSRRPSDGAPLLQPGPKTSWDRRATPRPSRCVARPRRFTGAPPPPPVQLRPSLHRTTLGYQGAESNADYLRPTGPDTESPRRPLPSPWSSLFVREGRPSRPSSECSFQPDVLPT